MEVSGLLIKLLEHNDELYFLIYSITCYVNHDSKVRDKYVLACYGRCGLGVFSCNSQKVAVAILTSRKLVTSKQKNILLCSVTKNPCIHSTVSRKENYTLI